MTMDEVKISPEPERLGNGSEDEEICTENGLDSRVSEGLKTENGLVS